MALPDVGLEAVIKNLKAFEAGSKAIIKAYDNINIKTDKVAQQSSHFDSILNTIGSGMANVGKLALGVGIAGITAVGGGLIAAGAAGLSFNASMEQARARLSAFVPNAEDVDAILKSLRAEADKTPFSFQEMSTAAASLIPAVKQSGVSLEELIKQAEILAASNPLQGLEGASFSLREAISGDTTSIVERFNLSRDTINKFKDEGMTAFEAVIATMKEMGLTSQLVSNMANTLSGRWSTFKDTLISFAGTATQPIFDKLSSGLGNLNTLIEANRPLINALADTLAQKVSNAIALVIDWSGKLSTGWTQLNDFMAANLTPKLNEVGAILTKFWAEILPPLQEAWTTLRTEWQTNVSPALAELAEALGIATGDVDFWRVALGTLKIALGLVTLAVKLITPEIKILSAVVTGTLQGFTRLVELATAAKRGFDTLTGTVVTLSKKILDFSQNLISIFLPDWLMPGSPTPFELGLIGIGQAILGRLIPALQSLNNTLTLVFANWGVRVMQTKANMLILQTSIVTVDTKLILMNTHILAIGTSFNNVATASNNLIGKLNQIVTALTTVKNSAGNAVDSMNSLNAVSFGSLMGRIDDLRNKVNNLSGSFSNAEGNAKDLRNVSFSPLQSALSAINTTVLDIISNFNAMAEAANNAANAANGSTSGLSTSALGALGATLTPGVVAGPSIVNNVTNNYYDMNNSFGGNTINGGFDQGRFDQMVLQALQRLMR